jgi:protein subunit release factor B
MTRKLLFSVTPKDCELQTFRAGGKGGQKQNKTDSGVRWIHHPSGARGESREERSQLQNKKIAWRRMCATPEFKLWVKKQCGADDIVNAQVERAMWPVNIKTEVKQDGRWVKPETPLQ